MLWYAGSTVIPMSTMQLAPDSFRFRKGVVTASNARSIPARWATRTMAIKTVDLADSWALRDLTICVRDFEALPPYARQLVEHMRAGAA